MIGAESVSRSRSRSRDEERKRGKRLALGVVPVITAGEADGGVVGGTIETLSVVGVALEEDEEDDGGGGEGQRLDA